MKIIDTHLHIWNLEELSLPWLSGEGPVLNRTYTLEDYENALGSDPAYQVEAAVYVEVDSARTDKDRENAFIIGCCADGESLFRGAILSGYLNEDGFKEYMGRYLDVGTDS